MREYSRTYTQYYTNGTAARQIAQPEYERPERRRSEQELPDYAKVRKNSTQKGLKLAMNELGMVYPTEGQVVYYDLTESDYVHQFTDIPQ